MGAREGEGALQSRACIADQGDATVPGPVGQGSSQSGQEHDAPLVGSQWGRERRRAFLSGGAKARVRCEAERAELIKETRQFQAPWARKQPKRPGALARPPWGHAVEL